jgi:hypothetical protein
MDHQNNSYSTRNAAPEGPNPAGLAASISKVHWTVVVCILLALVGLSTWGLVTATKPIADRFLDETIDQYDALLPEISITSGKASIREEQPYFVEKDKEGKTVVVIDTREGKEDQAMGYFKGFKTGLVLSREVLILKHENGRIQIVPLKNIPDLVLNSRNLRKNKDMFFPTIVRFGAILVLLWFLVVKPVQALILATIPMLIAPRYSAPLSLGKAFKISVFCMIPPVAFDLFRYFWGLQLKLPLSLLLYVVLYVALLILAVRDLAAAEPVDSTANIGPGAK